MKTLDNVRSLVRIAVLGLATMAAAPVAAQTTSIGDGAAPPVLAGQCPVPDASTGTPQWVDAFTLSTTAPSETILSISVLISPANAYRYVDKVEIRTDGGAVIASYSPIGDLTHVAIPAGAVVATSSPVQYRLYLTQKKVSQLPQSAATTDVNLTARVYDVRSQYAKVKGDTTSRTFTIDNSAPADVNVTGVSAASNSISLDFTSFRVVVLRSVATPVTGVPTEGVDYNTVGAAVGNSFVACGGATAIATCAYTVPPADAAKPHYFKIFTRDSCGNYSPGVAVGPIVAETGGGTEGNITVNGKYMPVIGLLNPVTETVASTGFKVQARIFSPKNSGGTDQLPSNIAVEWTGAATGSQALSKAAAYGGDNYSGVWETTVVLPVGNYTLRARASNPSGGPVYTARLGIRVSSDKGDGNLLVRDNSATICTDCHANYKSHTAETMGGKYGSWYTGCRSCHAPHGTTNASLIANKITPPALSTALPPSDVNFSVRTGYAPTGGIGNLSAASFANGDQAANGGAATGVCQVCHTRTTTAYKRDGTLVTHYPNNNCAGCHKHDAGFAAACNGCHGASAGRTPGAGVTGTDTLLSAAPPKAPNEAPAVSPLSPAPFVAGGGVHLQHVNQNTYRTDALQCAECHLNFGHGDGDIDLNYNSTLGLADGATASPIGTTDAIWAANPTCTNYCHGATIQGGSGTISWDTPQTLTCTSCHGYPPLTKHDGSAHPGAATCDGCHPGYTSPVLSALAKVTHINGLVEGASCTGCHGNDAVVVAAGASVTDVPMAPPKTNRAGSTISDPITATGVGLHQRHVNDATIEAPFLACTDCHGALEAGHPGTAGYPTQLQLPSNGATATYNFTNATCSNVYCHNPTPATPGTVTQPSFYVANNLTCIGCHDDAASLTSGAHEMHTADGGAYKGTTYNCATCHTNVNATNNGFVTKATHVDGTKDLLAATSWTGTTCNASQCHSKGTEVVQYVTATWSGGAAGGTCKECHGTEVGSIAGAPWYANGYPSTDSANSHDKHLKATDTTAACYACHNQTVTAAGALVGARHLDFDATVDVTGAAITGGYNGTTETCSTITCHGGKNAVWGATLSCADCHTNATTDTDSFAFGTAGIISESQWTSSGHGQATFGTNTFPTIATGKPCLYCHDPSVNHDVAGNPYRLIGATGALGAITAGNYSAATATSANQACLNCHATAGANGVNAAAQGLKTSTKKIDAYHYGADHGTRTGGYRCWDCHDPHGDGNIKMIGTKVVKTSTDNHSWAATRVTGVTFTANLTGTDYANASATSLCRACHETAAHYNLTTNDGHQSGTKCLSCHSHNQTPNLAFMNVSATNCSGCHLAPPANGKHAIHDSTAFAETTYTNTARHADASNYGYACGTCHSGTHMNDASSPYGVQVVFGNFDAQAVGGGYTAGAAQPDDVQGALAFSWTAGTCGTTYCHSNGAPLGGTVLNNAVTWTEAAWTASNKCTKCHKMSATNTVPDTNLSHGHFMHTTATASGGYFFNCSQCHNGVATGASDYPTTAGTIVSKLLHANGSTHTVAFDAAFNPGTTGYTAGTYTCNNTYCHSNGQNAASPNANTSIAWNASVAANCSGCHGGYTGTFIASGKHTEHVNNTTDLGTNYECDDCHATTVAGGATPTVTYTGGQHVDRTKDVSIQNRGTMTSTDTGTTCGTTYCHSDGQRGAANTKVTATWAEATWAGNICIKCHGATAGATWGAPDYANGGIDTATANSHGGHVDANTDCAICHSGMVNATATAITGALHTNGVIDVAFNSTAGASAIHADGTTTPTSATCTSIACHGTNTSPVKWGDTLDCSGCHMAAAGATDGEVDDYTYGNGTTAKIDPEDWANYGHGRATASGNYNSGNVPANFDNGVGVSSRDGCLYCHIKSVPHGAFGTSTNPFRLANVGAGTTLVEKNGVCTKCHGGTGYDPDGAGTVYANVTSPDAVDNSHYGAKHAAGRTGGQLCWDCHDPHGDSRYAANATETPAVTAVLGYMLDARLTRTGTVAAGSTTEWGQNPTLTTSAVVFNDTTDGSAGYAWGDYAVVSPNFNGVCQVCHTAGGAVNFNTTTYTAGHYNTSGRCVTCHMHDQVTNLAFKENGECIQCHAGTQGTSPVRRAIVTEFMSTWSHKRSGGKTVANADCAVCHMEAISPADPRMQSGSHGNKYIDLRDPDTGSNIRGVYWTGTGAGAYTSTTTYFSFTQFSRNLSSKTLEAAVQAIQINQCLKCHDANGAASTLARVPGAPSGGRPFNTTISGAAYTGSGITAFGTIGNVTDIDASFNPTNSSVHPVKGKGNNWYTKLSRMKAPWNTTTRGASANLTSWGDMLSCWDCHAPNGTASTQTLTTTVTAHGGATSLRGSPTSSGTPTAGTASTLCMMCHNMYDTCGGTATTTCGSTTSHGAGSAFSSNPGRSAKTAFLVYGCNKCHSSTFTTAAARPIRGQDVHGFNRLPGTGTDEMWPTGATETQRPYAFIRNTQMFSNHITRSRNGAATTYVATCVHLNDGVCTSRSETYTVGGTY